MRVRGTIRLIVFASATPEVCVPCSNSRPRGVLWVNIWRTFGGADRFFTHGAMFHVHVAFISSKFGPDPPSSHRAFLFPISSCSALDGPISFGSEFRVYLEALADRSRHTRIVAFMWLSSHPNCAKIRSPGAILRLHAV